MREGPLQNRMLRYLCLILVLCYIRTSSAFLGGNSFNSNTGGGSIFDSFLQAFSAPTTSPFGDPFSNSFGLGGNSYMKMFPLMMADIDYADQISGMADTRAGKREAQQGMHEARQGQQQGGGAAGAKEGAQTQFNRFNRNRALHGQQASSFYPQRRTEAGSFGGESPHLSGHQSMPAASGNAAAQPSKWVFKQNKPEVQQKKPEVIPKRSGFLPHQERNRLRLSQVLRPLKGAQQLKDGAADAAISRNDVKPNNNVREQARPSRLHDRTPPRRQRMDPDIMSDMIDLATDFGIASMLMPQMSRTLRGGRCDPSSIQALMEYMMTGRMCGSPRLRFGLGR